ncbi:DUF3299 domain-containing protein [Tropicibacter sp. Alg240-R139]|uniref:DUF3299 domain-containing protein n=1 Tax=Tropicibacter sp. Alg240-R139 TaxID=2305991 RepID=UPI0013DF7F79|nr:DUF3299 domain-containing protein [Tropicibacter sp. Alg240-R139]
MVRTTIKALSTAVLVLFVLHGAPHAEPLQSTWKDLRKERPAECQAFLEQYLAHPDCAQQTMMATLAANRIAMCTSGDSSLDGKTITIAGYAHPFELAFSGVKEFLLIPRAPQDCRHPPPPLPDQIISVDFPEGLDINLDPVWVTGVLRVRPGETHLAPVSYFLEATSVAPALIPDVPESG